MKELRCISANGLMHANGFPPESLDRGMEHDPHFIGVDTGSTDSGPYYLGSGRTQYPSRHAVNEVLRVLMTRAVKADIPLIIGSAGTAGAQPHLDWLRKSVEQVAEQEELEINLASIYSDIPKETMKEGIQAGRISRLGEADPLTQDEVDGTDNIVGVMGPEPYIDALEKGADVVLAGRSSDVAIYKALAVKNGFPEGLATHMAKIIECGGLIVEPSTGGECVFARLDEESFLVQPTNPEKHVTPLIVASHMLYEQANPYEFVEPRGVLDTRDSTYEAVDERTVEVKGSTFDRADQYTIKIEGAREVGHRATSTVGIRDPILVGEQIEPFISAIRERLEKKAKELGTDPESYELNFHVYGKNAVMKDREFVRNGGHELAVFVDVVAPTKDEAYTLLHLANTQLQHTDFPGRKCTSGNVATPISPKDVYVGKAYEFNIHHALDVDDPLELFDIRMDVVGGA